MRLLGVLWSAALVLAGCAQVDDNGSAAEPENSTAEPTGAYSESSGESDMESAGTKENAGTEPSTP